MYVDPSSGYKVFTEYAHLQRGKCCGSACRHVSSLFSFYSFCSVGCVSPLHCSDCFITVITNPRRVLERESLTICSLCDLCLTPRTQSFWVHGVRVANTLIELNMMVFGKVEISISLGETHFEKMHSAQVCSSLKYFRSTFENLPSE